MPRPGGNQARQTWSFQRIKVALQALIIPAAFIAVWQLVIITIQPPKYLLPAPIDVWNALWDPTLNWPFQVWVTAQEAVGGFVLALVMGIVLAIIISWTPVLTRLFLPMFIVFDTLPKIAIAPLFIIYLGYGIFPNTVLAGLIAFFPVLISTVTGIQQTDDDLLDLARSLGAPKWKVFLRIRLPSAVPYILTSAIVAATMATTGAVVGEFLASQAGLGNMVIRTQVSLQLATAFAALVYLAMLGFGIYALVSFLGRRMFPWVKSSDGGRA